MFNIHGLRLLLHAKGAPKWWEGSDEQGIHWAISDDGGASWGGQEALVPAPDGLPAWGPVLYSEVTWFLSDSNTHRLQHRFASIAKVLMLALKSDCHHHCKPAGHVLTRLQCSGVFQDAQSSCCRARRHFSSLRFRGAAAGGKGRAACTGHAVAMSTCRGSPQTAEPPGQAPRSALLQQLGSNLDTERRAVHWACT